MTVVADFVTANKRFSRSANVERDHGASAIGGYVPTGRAVDVVDRIARGILDAAAGRTFSITGPHGGGKSSLAVFISALLSASSTAEYKAAIRILSQADPSTTTRLKKARETLGLERNGFVPATATARAESVSITVARALHRGATTLLGEAQDVVPPGFARPESEAGLSDEILEVIPHLSSDHPTLLVVDEFGKNLEAYARARYDGDPFLLQQIAELTQGENALPLVVITMQHLSLDEYVQDASAARRREWAKVQGRFQDIPYVETPEQSRRLICESLKQSPELDSAVQAWMLDHEEDIADLNLREIATDAVGAAPLHPVTLAVLPELCIRYGQNERTLFSFVGGGEPLAVPELLKTIAWQPGQSPRFIGVDRVYDYFVESVRSMVGVSQGASRWVEIETRIRDTPGLSDSELRALKTVGLLNLVSTGGKVRASRRLLEFALSADDHIASADSVRELLDGLEKRGLVAYRTFSDEYRIWQGSDYDLKRAISSAQRQVETEPLANLLNETADLQPRVAGRHSQRAGILRIFGQLFGDLAAQHDLADDWDGLVLYSTATEYEPADPEPGAPTNRPIVVVVPESVDAVAQAAVEAGTLRRTLRAAQEEDADWVAIRELSERSVAAQQHLLSIVARTWDSTATWSVPGFHVDVVPAAGLSSVLSDVADVVYASAPQLRNEMIARRELTSQGAKARRFLIDAMLESTGSECFGLKGYGPERAIYEAVFRWTGMHQADHESNWKIGAPRDRQWKRLWNMLNAALDSTDDQRVSLPEITRLVERPPYGLKAGILPILVVALIVARRDEIALYEHGSLVLEIDDAVAERLARNPWHFAVRNSATQGSARSAVVEALAERMRVRAPGGSTPTFLNVTSALFRELRLLPPYVQKTRASLSVSAESVREAFHTATEPDVLLFEALPEVLGVKRFTPRGRKNLDAARAYADQLAAALSELKGSYGQLLTQVASQLAEATSLPADLGKLHPRLHARAVELEGRVLEPRLRAFVGALTRDLAPQPWLENVAMVVSEGQAPRVWTDDIADRFPLRVAELGGAMRRTEALLYDHLSRDPQKGFQTTRIALTQPDGTEWNELVAITDEDRERMDKPFYELLQTLTNQFGSRAAACRMLIARLAVEELGTTAGDEPNTPRGAQHG